MIVCHRLYASTASTFVQALNTAVTVAAAAAAAIEQFQPIIVPILNRIQTYFITNKYTKPFQMLIESLGVVVVNYRERNPASYTIVTIYGKINWNATKC